MLKGGEALFRRGLQTVATAKGRIFESHQAQYLRRAEEQAVKMETLFGLLRDSGIEAAHPMETGFSTTYIVDDCINPIVGKKNPLSAFFSLGDQPASIEVTNYDAIRSSVQDQGAEICSIRFTKIVDDGEVAVRVIYDSRSVPTPDKPWLDPLKVDTYMLYPHSDIPKKVSVALKPFAGMDDPRFTESDDKLELAEALIKIAERLTQPKPKQANLTDPQMMLNYPGTTPPLF